MHAWRCVDFPCLCLRPADGNVSASMAVIWRRGNHQTGREFMLIVKRLETITIAIATFVAIVIGILDLAGALEGVGWLRNRISVLTLLVVGALAAHLIIEQSL